MQANRSNGLYSNWLFEVLSKRGISLKEVATSRGTSEDKLRRQLSNLEFNQYLEILNWAVTRCDDPFLGLHIGAEIIPEQYGIFGYLLRHSVSFAELCNMLSRYISLLTPAVSIDIVHLQATSKLVYSINLPIHHEAKHDIDHTMAAIVSFFRSQLGDNWQPTTTGFEYPAPKQRAIYTDFFGPSVKFAQPENFVEFDNRLLVMSLSDADPRLLKVLLQQADQILSGLAQKPDLINKTKMLIMSELHAGELNSDDAARQLNMSRTTYYRRLKERGTSFRLLKEKIIEQTAKKLLLETEASISEIAQNLGFSEHSAFVHFFSRTVANSPSQYRKLNKTEHY